MNAKYIHPNYQLNQKPQESKAAVTQKKETSFELNQKHYYDEAVCVELLIVYL